MRQPSLFRSLTVFGLFAIGLMPLATVKAGTTQGEAYDIFHQDLAKDDKYNAVGKMIIHEPGLGIGLCSGTVINKRWVLTAAHCVAGADKINFKLNGKKYRAKRWYSHKAYDRTVLGNGRDIALLRLTRPVAGHNRARLATRRSNPIGERTTRVGYGTGGTGLTGNNLPYGTKRAGHNIIDSYDPDVPGNRVLRSDFDPDPNIFGNTVTGSEDYPVTLEYSAAQGDSGGPVFDDDNRIIGVTSFGTVGSFFFGTGGDTNVAIHRNWIRKVMRLSNQGNTAKLATIAKTGNAANVLPGLLSYTYKDHLTGQIVAPLMYRDNPQLLAAALATIPEPTTVLMLSVGSLALLRRRRLA